MLIGRGQRCVGWASAEPLGPTGQREAALQVVAAWRHRAYVYKEGFPQIAPGTALRALHVLSHQTQTDLYMPSL